MPTLFISDLHLDPSYPITTEKFLEFISHHAVHADALYILGDFFEIWIGDDYQNTWLSHIKNAIKKLTQSGVPVFIMHGNRDFLIGDRFLAETGCQLLPDPSVVTIYTQKILLMHGDTLCLDDISYLRFRHINRLRFMQRCFLLLPLRYRHRLANKIRHVSQQKDTQLQDITHGEIPRLMDQHRVKMIIHGHTHRPAIHYLNIHQHALLHIVLSDWHERGNVLEMNPNGQFTLRYF